MMAPPIPPFSRASHGLAEGTEAKERQGKEGEEALMYNGTTQLWLNGQFYCYLYWKFLCIFLPNEPARDGWVCGGGDLLGREPNDNLFTPSSLKNRSVWGLVGGGGWNRRRQFQVFASVCLSQLFVLPPLYILINCC